ncbi:hypothetical protein JCM3766R1_006790 [Sporobolomyces carnicolor]
MSAHPVTYWRIEERFSRFLKAMLASFYNRPEVSSYETLHRVAVPGSNPLRWSFHVKDCAELVCATPFKNGPEEFDGWIAVFPNITIDGQVFPQYVKPSRARRDDTSDTSPIKQFHSAGDKWVAPTEAVVPGDPFVGESWQLLHPARTSSERGTPHQALMYRLKLTDSTTGREYKLLIHARKGQANAPVLEMSSWSLSHRQRSIYRQRSALARV